MSPSFRPTRLSAGLALLVAIGAVLVGIRAPLIPLAVTTLGFVAFAAGLLIGTREWVASGTVMLVVGMVLTSLTGVSLPIVLLGTLATLVSWDLAEHAIGLGHHVGRDAGTRRNEAVHAGLSGLFGGIGVVLALTASTLSVHLSLPAFLVLLFGGIVLVAVLRT